VAGRNIKNVVEAILFASESALSADRIAGALERKDATPGGIREAIAELNAHYRQTDRTFEIVEVAGGFKMMTLPEYNNYIRRVLRSRSRDKLSQAALETMAIVAYRQPITRAEIENIRGVEAGPILRMLVDRGLVKIVGRSEKLGHPLLYGTTRLFLEIFGLNDLDVLLCAEELMARQAAEDDEDAEDASPESSEAVAGAMAALSDGEENIAATADADVDAEADDEQAVIRLSNHLADNAPPAETETPADEDDKPTVGA
jgi:segregation and condensation protein B